MCIEAHECSVSPQAEEAAVMVICTFGSRRAGCDGLSGSWTGVAEKAGGLALPAAGEALAGLLAQAKPSQCAK